MRVVKFLFSRLFFCILVIAVIFAAIIFLCLCLHSLLPAALGGAIGYAFSFGCALFLLCRDGRGDYKCAWLALIAALPVLGAALYAFSCTGIERRRDNPLPPPLSSYEECEYFKDGERYLARLEECVAAAKYRVYLEYYIISKGKIWNGLCKRLESALARGVDVMIICDGLGSAGRTPKKDFSRLKKAGARIKIFNKLLPFPVSRLNCRNHRKIAAIDGQTVFLGGVNIADEYANINSPYGYWKDGGVMLRGDVALDYERIFLKDFYADNRYLPEKIQGGKGEKNDNDESGQGGIGGNGGKSCGRRREIRIVADEPANANGCCEELIAAKIYSAERRVCVFTPYLCVGEKLKDALIYAAGRGVRVVFILPHIPDKRITFEISLTYAQELRAYGIEVYRFKPGFLHAKCVLCDDEALLGSYNFDFRSMRLNYECGIWAGGELAESAYADFKECLVICEKIGDMRTGAPRRLARAALKIFSPLF